MSSFTPNASFNQKQEITKDYLKMMGSLFEHAESTLTPDKVTEILTNIRTRIDRIEASTDLIVSGSLTEALEILNLEGDWDYLEQLSKHLD